jgi:membrane-bound lytic murein transglycosylase F
VLIYNLDNPRPTAWSDLAGERVAVLEHSGLAAALGPLRAQHPEVVWETVALASTEALISQVSDGTRDYAIVAANDADAARNGYLNFERGFPLPVRLELAWAFPAGQDALRAQADTFLAEIGRDGTLRRLVERYFNFAQVPRFDAGAFLERMRALLPQYRAVFQYGQQVTGIEWRLLAAIAYQESQWDVQAVSETGVRGIMQLTEDTARQIGVNDRMDVPDSVLGAARYLRQLKDKLPARIGEPDRTWLALAAYNIGTAHLEDARILAQKQKTDPDSWAAVRKALPLLAQPEYYEDAKFGYARGGMPVAFVERVRAYYDILLAQQPDARPRLRAWSNAIELAPGRSDLPTLGTR